MALEMLVEAHHKLMYANSVKMVAQQKRNPLLGAVTEIPASGEAQSVADLIGAIEYLYGEERSRVNVENPAGKSRRWCVMPPEIESGQYITKEEKFRTATDPTSNYVVAHTKAVLRGRADRVVGIRKVDGEYVVSEGGILGIAREGKTPGTGMPLPTSQYVPVGVTGLTLDKLRDGVKQLKKDDFGLEDDDQLFGLITPEQEDNLLDIVAATGASLNSFQVEQLKSGKPTMLMKTTWIVTNRLPKNDAGNRLCPIFSKANIIAALWQDVQGAMWNDTHAKNLPYCHVGAYVDCVRAEDKGVIVIECAE